MFNSTLPEHALSATKILYLVSKSAPIQSDLVTLFTEEKVFHKVLKQKLKILIIIHA